MASGSTDRGAAVLGVAADTFGNFYYAARYGNAPSEVVTLAVPQVCADWFAMEDTERATLFGAGALAACQEQLGRLADSGSLMTVPSEAG